MKRKSVVPGAAVAVVGLMAITTLMVPASAHVNTPLTFSHLKKHFYTKAQSNARFINVGELSAGPPGPQGIPGPTASATASSDTNSSITSGVNNVLSATITVTVPSRLLVASNVEVDADGGSNDDAFCYLNKGDTGAGADDISQRVTVDIPATNLARGNIANHGSMDVQPGTYTIRVFCGVNVAGQTIAFDSGDMWVIASAV